MISKQTASIIGRVKAKPVMPASYMDLAMAERAGLIERRQHGGGIAWHVTSDGAHALTEYQGSQP